MLPLGELRDDGGDVLGKSTPSALGNSVPASRWVLEPLAVRCSKVLP